MRVLDLESQTELLDRLRLITRFGSSIVSVTGDIGSGKSWLAQRYLESWVPEKNQSLLMCHPSQTDGQHRSTILKQLVPNALYNESNPLLDSFEHLLAETRCDVVIVVDDAELLSPTIIQELYFLVAASMSSPFWSINVVLFSSKTSINRVLEKLSDSFDTKPIEIDVEPLSEIEVDAFLLRQVFSIITDPKQQSKIERKAKKCEPLPGALMELAQQKNEKKVIIRSIVASPLNIALILILVLALLGGGYYWLLGSSTQQTEQEIAERVALETERIEQEILVQQQQAEQAKQGAASDADSEAVEDGVIYDNDALPPEVSTKLVSVGKEESDKQRVVVPDQLVDALIENQPNTDTSIIDNALVDARSKPESIIITDEVVEPAPEVDVQKSIVETESQAQDEEPDLLITFSYARDELNAVSGRHYTVQLGAMKSLQDVQEFINLHQLDNRVRVYPTTRNNIEWYIITHKDFDTIQKARDAIGTLSAELQAIGPWAKSMAQVHREIDSEK